MLPSRATAGPIPGAGPLCVNKINNTWHLLSARGCNFFTNAASFVFIEDFLPSSFHWNPCSSFTAERFI